MAGSVAGAGVYRRCDLGAVATHISNARIFGNVTHGGRATSFAANTRFVINVFDPCIHAAKAKMSREIENMFAAYGNKKKSSKCQ